MGKTSGVIVEAWTDSGCPRFKRVFADSRMRSGRVGISVTTMSVGVPVGEAFLF